MRDERGGSLRAQRLADDQSSRRREGESRLYRTRAGGAARGASFKRVGGGGSGSDRSRVPIRENQERTSPSLKGREPEKKIG